MMESFGLYLLKSVSWLTGFALVYFLFLRNERFFRLKRLYLIAGIIASFIFPLIAIRFRVEIPFREVTQNIIPSASENNTSLQSAAGNSGPNISYPFLVLYLAGILILLVRGLFNLNKLAGLTGRYEVVGKENARLIRSSGLHSSFSFINYIFIDSSASETETDIIMNHEMAHVREKHWIDLLLAEMLRILQWFNPLAWIYTGFVRQNHEYIADEIALQKTPDAAAYKAVLVNQLFNSRVISLSNSFTYSLNKRRFDMMKKTVTSPFRRLRMLIILPVFGIILYAFATPEYHYLPSPEQQTNPLPDLATVQKEARGIVVNEEGKPLQGVSILVSKSLTGVITGANGRFAISRIPDGSALVFSCKGYKTYTLPPLLSSNFALMIRLARDPDYKEADTVKIRTIGDSTIKAVVFVDGIEIVPDKITLDPNSISSVNVLKDKPAIDRYGAKGINGVIEITTKKAFGAADQQKARETVTEQPQTAARQPGPLVVIDGAASDKYYVDAMKELGHNLGISKTLMGKEATDKYGEKGAGGVLEITTRKKALEMGLNPPYNRIDYGDFPTFGGKDQRYFTEWVTTQVKYPEEAKALKAGGYVTVNFTVEINGSLTNIKATSSTPTVLNDEVIRVIKTSPKWEPPRNREINEPFNTGVTIGFRESGKVMDQLPFVVVEEMPVYPGGEKELLRFINDNVVYPEAAKAEKPGGKVIVRFVVNTAGNTEGVSAIKAVHPLLDAEAVRVVSLLKGFKPGRQNGVDVPVWYMVPVNFTPPETQQP